MVQNVIEPFNVDVIKVTIKDKPGLVKPASEESLRLAFKALQHYARQEQRIRALRAAIATRSSRRELQHFFDGWRERARTARRLAEQGRAEGKLSNDRKIERLVQAIAEKQKEPAPARDPVRKSAPAAQSKKQEQLAKRAQTAKPKHASLHSGTQAQNRLEAQKMIIQEQRAKLAEQNKMIENMKLKEFDKEAKCSSKETIKVAKQALKQCDQRTRRSIVHLMREQGCRDESVVEIPRIPSPPGFLIRMETRAEARKQRMKEAYELRRRKLEEEKKREEASRREAEEVERQQQIQAIKETKKQRKEQEIRRLKEINRNKRLEHLADQCYKRYLFRRYVLDPFSSLVDQKNNCLKRADQHYGETLLFKIFSAWKNQWIDEQETKLQLASRLYRHNLLWYNFIEWKTFALDMKQKHQVAVDFFEIKLQGKCIRAWHTLCAEIKAIEHKKEVKARKHYEKHMKLIFFERWKQYMTISDDIKEREQRRDEWRDLIKKFIPDTS